MVTVKTDAEIAIMAEGGRKLAEITGRIANEVREGVSLRFLDDIAHRLMKASGGQPAFLNYQPDGAAHPFPASICTSLNDIVVHGIPTDYRLTSGDVLKIDLGLRYQGFYADTAITMAIGSVSARTRSLIEITKEALMKGIAAAVPGNTLGDIGSAVQSTVAAAKFKIVRGLTGHGIGRELHEDPSVLNEGRPGQGMKLVPGLALAIEVMTAASTHKIVQRADESYATADGSLSAHFEHTVAITPEGPRILTVI